MMRGLDPGKRLQKGASPPPALPCHPPALPPLPGQPPPLPRCLNLPMLTPEPLFLAFSHLVVLHVLFCLEHTSFSWPGLSLQLLAELSPPMVFLDAHPPQGFYLTGEDLCDVSLP